MKFHFIFGVLIILMGTTYSSGEARIVNEQRILLRKLQNNQRLESKDETKSVTWNEVLAGVIVDSVKSVSSESKQISISRDTIYKKEGFFANILSNTLYLYKKYIYDKFISKNTVNKVHKPEDWTGDPDFDTLDPGKDIEVFQPKYHGKNFYRNGTESEIDEKEAKVGDCPEGSSRNSDGSCTASLLLAVPNQCPRGYRRDRLGFCRLSF